MGNRLFATGSFLLLFLCTSCIPKATLTPIPLLTTPREVYHLLHERDRGSTPYRALVTVQPVSRHPSPSIEAALRFEPPDKVHLTGLSPLGVKLFDIESSGGSIRLDLPDGRVFSGPPAVLSRFFKGQLPMTLDQVEDALHIYDVDSGPEGTFFLSEDPGHYILSKIDVAGGCSADDTGNTASEKCWAYPLKAWWVEKKTLHLVRKEVFQDPEAGETNPGRKVFIIEYSDFHGASSADRGGDGGWIPHRMTLKKPDGTSLVDLVFHEIRVGDEDPGT